MGFTTNPNKMERHNTDDIFKKMLENPPPMRPDMEALEDMNKRLDAAKNKEKVGGLWWLVPLLFLPFVFGTFFFYHEFQTAKKTISDLNLELTELSTSSTNNQNLISRETLTKQITIYKYDTIFNKIYQDVIIQRKINEISATVATIGENISNINYLSSALENFNVAFADKVNTFDNSSYQPSQLELLGNGKVLSLGQIGAILVNGQIAGNATSSNENRLNSLAPSIERIAFLNNRFQFEYPLPNSDHFLNLNSKSENDINPLWYLVPTGLQIGMNWSPVGIVKSTIGNKKVKSIGILGEVEFTKSTRLQFGLNYLSIPISAESQEELAQFPALSPDDSSDILKELYGDFNYLEVPLSLKYVFNPDRKWKPSIGIGMIARLPIREQLRYEFVSNQGGEYKINQIIEAGSSFNVNNIRGSIGLEYNFYKNYTIQAEGFYNYQFGTPTNPYLNFRYGGLNMGLKYKF